MPESSGYAWLISSETKPKSYVDLNRDPVLIGFPLTNQSKEKKIDEKI